MGPEAPAPAAHYSSGGAAAAVTFPKVPVLGGLGASSLSVKAAAVLGASLLSAKAGAVLGESPLSVKAGPVLAVPRDKEAARSVPVVPWDGAVPPPPMPLRTRR